MKLGFTFRRIVIKIERAIMLFLIFLDYFLWSILYIERFFVPKPKKIKKVLVVHPNGYLGDALNTYCVTEKLKRKYKKIDFYFFTIPKFAKMVNEPKVISSYEEVKKIEPFDVMVIVGVDPLTFQKIFSFSNYKVGTTTGGPKTFLEYKFFLNKRIYPYFKNTVKERFMYFELAGFKFKDYKLELPFFKEYHKEAKRLMKKLKIKKNDKICFFNPAANSAVVARKKGLYPANKWDRFHELADLLEDYKILIPGTKEDEFLAKKIIKKTKHKNIHSICGKTSFLGLGELMRIFKDNGCLISVNTGTAHLGVAVGIKTVEILRERFHSVFGNNAISLYASSLVCRGCRKYYCLEENSICMNSISPDMVLYALNKLKNEK